MAEADTLKSVNATPGPETVPQIDVEPVNAAEHRPLYEKRKKIFPRRAQGTFRRIKWAVLCITLGIYYVLPWIRWDRGPNAPESAPFRALRPRGPQAPSRACGHFRGVFVRLLPKLWAGGLYAAGADPVPGPRPFRCRTSW